MNHVCVFFGMFSVRSFGWVLGCAISESRFPVNQTILQEAGSSSYIQGDMVTSTNAPSWSFWVSYMNATFTNEKSLKWSLLQKDRWPSCFKGLWELSDTQATETAGWYCFLGGAETRHQRNPGQARDIDVWSSCLPVLFLAGFGIIFR